MQEKFDPTTAQSGYFTIHHTDEAGHETHVPGQYPMVLPTLGHPAMDVRRVRGLAGLEVFDPGFSSTSVGHSAITFIDGRGDGTQGKLYYRGYAIEELAEKCSYTEVSYLLLYGALPDPSQLEQFEAKLK